MTPQEELQVFLDARRSVIKHWTQRLHAALQDDRLEDASYFARAIGSEWELIARALHDARQQRGL